MAKHTQQTLALSGIAQSAFLVHQLGRHGLVQQENFSTCIDSLFVINPSSTEAVYGRLERLNKGLLVLKDMFQSSSVLLKHPDVMRYFFGILYLEGKTSYNKQLLSLISEGLERIERTHPEDAKAGNEDVIKQLAGIYQRSVGTLNFRVQVKGDIQFLRNDLIAAKIRATLLAGIRSAVLWRQLGGRRWHLMVYRRRIKQDINQLLGNQNA